jgi:phage terminase large subunit GpA-like protein
VVPTKWAEVEIQEHDITVRVVDVPRGVVPAGCRFLTAAIDLGKHLDHWVVTAWNDGPFGHVVDYGRIEVATDSLGLEAATMVALREFRDMVKAGWPIGSAAGEKQHANLTLIDAGYMTDVVYAFARETGRNWVPSVGRGATQQHKQYTDRVTTTGATTSYVGDAYHINWLPAAQVNLVELNSDHWKTYVQQRLRTPMSTPGAMTLFQASSAEHLTFAKHLTAERKVEEFISGKGIVARWERVRRNNHWFDALAYACVAAHYCGVRLVEEEEKPKPAPKPKEKKPSPFVDPERWRQANAWWREGR